MIFLDIIFQKIRVTHALLIRIKRILLDAIAQWNSNKCTYPSVCWSARCWTGERWTDDAAADVVG